MIDEEKKKLIVSKIVNALISLASTIAAVLFSGVVTN